MSVRRGSANGTRAVRLSERTVITLTSVIKLLHAGYRCPNPECPAHGRAYRSAVADALVDNLK